MSTVRSETSAATVRYLKRHASFASSSRAVTLWASLWLACTMIATSPLQREVDKKYALQFIAVLGLAAACCAGLVGTVIWILGGI